MELEARGELLQSSPSGLNSRHFWVRPSGALLNPGVYAAVLLTAIFIVAAYQARPSYSIVVGSPIDGPYLVGFNTREQMQGDNPIPFRWTTDDAHIILPAIGSQDMEVTLTLNGGRPEGTAPAQLTIEAGGKQLLKLSPPAGLNDYRLSVPRDHIINGGLDLHLVSSTFLPPGDPNPRPLGVMITKVVAAPGSNSDLFIAPPSESFILLIGAVALLALALAMLGWGPGGVAVGGGALGLFAAALLVFDRLWLTGGEWYEAWPQALFAAALFALIVQAATRLLPMALRRFTSGTYWRLLLTLMLVVFAVRLAGELHPQIYIVDLGFHEHRFETVESGQLLFTIKSAEWAGRSTFYLPTAYVFMLPLHWLLGDIPLAIRLGMITLGTLGALLVYLVSVTVLKDARSGLLTAIFYVSLPISVLLFSWGIATNIFGEFFSLAALAVLVCGGGKLSPRSVAFWLLVFCVTMALLSHPGVVQLVSVAVCAVCAIWLLARRRLGGARPAAYALGAFALSAGIAYAIYYQHFLPGMIQTFGEIRSERAAQAAPGTLNLRVGGSVADRSLGLVSTVVDNWRDWFVGGLTGFWREEQAYYRVWPLFGALLGYMALWPGRSRTMVSDTRPRTRLVLVALGWLAAVVLFALVGWLLNLYVRYSLFALPIVALGCGALLSALWKRGRVAPTVVLLLVLFFAVEAFGLWQFRINYGLK
ncbi:MAG: hypothetical protein ABI670_08585 [Chloroflexota bacterium]